LIDQSGAGALNFQITVLKILVSYPDGFAVMEDLKRDMAILATSGRDWTDPTRRLASRVPDLDIFSQGLVERISGGWRVTAKGRDILAFMEPARHPASPVSPPPSMRRPQRYWRSLCFPRCRSQPTGPSRGASADSVAAKPANG